MHPIAFQFIHWYGVMVALGFLAGIWTASRRSPRGGMAPEKVVDLGPWLIIGAIVGARALHVVSYWREEYAGKPLTEIFAVWHGGLVYYGGLIGAALGCILFAYLKKAPLWKMADILAPSISLGQAFGRIGCLLNGCCYGRPCDLPWAIHFPKGHETYPRGVHPTEIYESALDFGLYLALAWLFRRKKFDGQVFATYLLSYAVVRSFVELFRGDYPPYQYLGGWITPAHLASAIILAAGVVLWLVLPRSNTQPASKA